MLFVPTDRSDERLSSLQFSIDSFDKYLTAAIRTDRLGFYESELSGVYNTIGTTTANLVVVVWR
jgi:hypothetical protein